MMPKIAELLQEAKLELDIERLAKQAEVSNLAKLELAGKPFKALSGTMDFFKGMFHKPMPDPFNTSLVKGIGRIK